MAKNKPADKPKPFDEAELDAGTSQAAPVSTTAVLQVVEPKQVEKSPASALYLVRLEGPDKWPEHKIQAASEEAAIEAYMKKEGITSTVHSFACNLCGPE